MSPAEVAAFRAGIRYAISVAQIAAVTLEVRDDAREVRQQAAVATLYGLVEGLEAQVSPPTRNLRRFRET